MHSPMGDGSWGRVMDRRILRRKQYQKVWEQTNTKRGTHEYINTTELEFKRKVVRVKAEVVA